MKYTSTRDSSISCSFEEAICSGYAPDGGLFVPESLPIISSALLEKEEWSKLTYPQLTQSVLRKFIASEEINDKELESICQSTLQGFDNTNHAVPIKEVGGIYVAELFHGPTFCFKDFGLRALVNLLSFFATKRNRSMTLLVSTTGDTGPAAVQAVSDINNPLLQILVHYPQNQISNFQRKQLTTVRSPCVKIATFQGGGDDMDRPIKSMLSNGSTSSDGQQQQQQTMTGVNSYNIGRPLMQMVHYIWAYLRVAEKLKIKPGDPEAPLINIVVPTGAMGNLVGGYMAKKMGIPIGKFCCGVNVNDITSRVIKTGQFYKNPIMKRTLSEAINIQLPYNFERLLFYLSDCNHSEIKSWMEIVDVTSKNDLSPQWLTLLQQEFQSDSITDEEMCEMTRQVYDDYGYYIDPHTAVAFGVAKKFGYYRTSKGNEAGEEEEEEDAAIDKKNETQQTSPTILLSTASPCKFEEAVTTAIGSEGWKEYYDKEFPNRGKSILDLEEVEPILYKAREGVPLEQTQLEWEEQARRIVQELSSVGTTKNGLNSH